MIGTFCTALLIYCVCILGLIFTVSLEDNQDLQIAIIILIAIVDTALIMYVLIAQDLVLWPWK